MIAALLLALAPPAAPPLLLAARGEAPAVEVWQVDQVRVPASTPEAKLKALAPDHSMDAVIKHLKELGVAFTRTQVGFVPSRMPDKLHEDLAKLPEGEPFILPAEGDYITINVIIGRRLPPDTVRYAPRPSTRQAFGAA